MAHIVLVHGAWQSASTWDLVKPLLEARGHQVTTPILTGLGSDADRLSPDVNLSQHIDDVTRHLSGVPEPVILTGHSYAGMIIAGAAEAQPDAVRELVFLDTFLPEDGQSVLDLLPAEVGCFFQQIAREHGDSWRLPPGEGHLDMWGLREGEPAREFVRQRLCDFTLRCFEEPIRLSSNQTLHIPSTYVRCVAPDYPARPYYGPFAAKAESLGWRVVEVDTGHDCHVEKPEEIAAIIG